MTTAQRPTWKAAVGRDETGGVISARRSALDAPGQLTLKRLSQPIEDRKVVIEKSLRALQDASQSTRYLKQPRAVDPQYEERAQQRLLKQTAEVDIDKLKEKYDDSDIVLGVSQEDASKEDEDDDDTDLDEDDDDDNSSSSEDDMDDEEALRAELEKIRAEREEETKRKKSQEEAQQQQQQSTEEELLLGNPLLAAVNPSTATLAPKRRWNEDVVFRNQAKGQPKPKKRFINDTVRNDFHKRFLNKFIR